MAAEKAIHTETGHLVDCHLSQVINLLAEQAIKAREVLRTSTISSLAEQALEAKELLRTDECVILRGISQEPFRYSIRAAYIFPNPLENEAIAGIVINRQASEELAKDPKDWQQGIRFNVKQAILNLPYANGTIDEAKIKRLTKAEFIRKVGDNIRSSFIVPIHRGHTSI
ncbi:hypothetical protein A3C33_03525 [Candidatus Curtissbacteria bacterium RIFCSPHIGHO2_02_FULL_42_58]|uniref:Uncharacterized protein n=1 Tax=Candidatus Curtissbacteria bacterium RIFCSPLOWO2_01_FULL_42_50 TaxID=1797730 RepID=A0A1F5H653_9BACT|nr:MAG: hypothetical protein A3C33_03525 [Candidatus Curtissbacteria bacterium RIFCSPHIGHO2_02_FULL_42_58]OGD97135.1 MAG: hypothetical protein A3E71_02930 [Candidatus Curtissbacteria bacterium RIFCSPHIGHO2_12_FULL_42_33]OGD99525.1 MAG: hypothetical protein A3B54_03425 [Candidatus Curtissbacteria bacterium RIFCSPLOWO2_01_FULL_42_50]OGE02270.1 MAG: hypothetical protein A3G16_01245 [Candidatus Curtissbacteria bacterium RIFCSPLOWO2_12_FULL_41_16]